jgi:hypothetical protein
MFYPSDRRSRKAAMRLDKETVKQRERFVKKFLEKFPNATQAEVNEKVLTKWDFRMSGRTIEDIRSALLSKQAKSESWRDDKLAKKTQEKSAETPPAKMPEERIRELALELMGEMEKIGMPNLAIIRTAKGGYSLKYAVPRLEHKEEEVKLDEARA